LSSLVAAASVLLSPLTRPPPRSTLFPYTTLFRSVVAAKLGVYHLEHGLYVVRLQLRVGAPENEDADAGVVVGAEQGLGAHGPGLDRKSTRLNSSHVSISYAVFCLKKKTRKTA